MCSQPVNEGPELKQGLINERIGHIVVQPFSDRVGTSGAGGFLRSPRNPSHAPSVGVSSLLSFRC